jgi:phosphoribosyl 1,2-cyclic phosphodiesterase
MRIKVWGARGSISVTGPDTLFYGGNTTCLELRSANGDLVLIDAGTGVRQAGKALMMPGEPRHVRFFFTHSHWDHLFGFPFFEPAYLPEFHLRFCGGVHAQESIRRYLGHQMEAPYFPVDFSNLKARCSFQCDNPHTPDLGCQLGGLRIERIALNHPNGGFGFRFTEDGRSFVFLTDNELGFEHPGGPSPAAFADFCRGATLLFHDAQYTDVEYEHTRGWGHSTYRDAVGLALAAGVERLGFFHHDPDRTDAQLDKQVAYWQAHLKETGSSIACFAAAEGMVIDV